MWTMASGDPFDAARLDVGASRGAVVPAWQSSLRHDLGRLRSARRRVLATFDATRQLATPQQTGRADSWDRYAAAQIRGFAADAVIATIGDNLDQAQSLLDSSAKAPRLRRWLQAGSVYESVLGSLHRGRENLFLVDTDGWVSAQLPTLRAGVATIMGSEDPRTEGYLRYLDDLMRSTGQLSWGPHAATAAWQVPGADHTDGSPGDQIDVPEDLRAAAGPRVGAAPAIPRPAFPAAAGTTGTGPAADRFGQSGTFDDATRERLRAIQTCVDDARMAAQIAVRVYRNALVAAICVLTVAVLVFPALAGKIGQSAAAAATAAGDALPFNTSFLAGVEVWGVLGSLVAVIAGLWRLRSSRQPSGLQLAQLGLKLPAGALTSLFGVLLLQGSLLQQISSIAPKQAPAYAILFGFAQEGLTRFVDGKANTLLESAKPLSDKAE
jgi:hypothetical protein